MRAAFHSALTGLLCLIACPVPVVSAGESYMIGSRGAQKPVNFGAPPEVKSPWYMRVEGGYVVNSSGDIRSESPAGLTLRSYADDTDSSGIFTVGAGYRVSPGFRLEGTLDYRPLTKSKAGIEMSGSKSFWQDGPQQTVTLSTGQQATVPSYDVSHFDVRRDHVVSSGRQSLMLFGYWDITRGSRVTPYVGAGIGANLLLTKSTSADAFKCAGSSNLYTHPETGQSVRTDLPVCKAQDFSEKSNRTGSAIGLAAAAAAGVGIQITPSVTLDLGYRLMWQAGETTLRWDNKDIFPSYAVTFSDRLDHEIRTGIRIAFD